jgi:hypothetical protein
MRFANIYHAAKAQKSYACPCCGFLTLYGRGEEEICAVCFWHDDGQDDHDAEEVRGGPNADLSLATARLNFRACGASNAKFRDSVRAPTEDEKTG